MTAAFTSAGAVNGHSDRTSAGRGATVWLTGLPSAGKSTLARALAERLRAERREVEVLDGDEIRAVLSTELGFTKEDRDLNVARIGYVASLLASHGVLVLVPVIAPYAEARAAVRRRHAACGADYVEVYVGTPVEICADRDVKGLYARQRAGELTGLTGVDDPYQAPQDPDIRVDTCFSAVEQTTAELYAALTERGLL